MTNYNDNPDAVWILQEAEDVINSASEIRIIKIFKYLGQFVGYAGYLYTGVPVRETDLKDPTK